MALQLASSITEGIGTVGLSGIQVDVSRELLQEQGRHERERYLRESEARLRADWEKIQGRRMAWQEKLEADAREDERWRSLRHEKEWERRYAASSEWEQVRFDEMMNLMTKREEAVKRREESLCTRQERMTRREVELEAREERLREEEDKQLRYA
jgi:hypothetical protein